MSTTATRSFAGVAYDNGDGTSTLVDPTHPLPVTAGAGTGAADLGKAEDAAHASGDTGVMMLAVRKDTAAALAGTDGDYIPIIVDASGRLHVAPLAAGTAIVGKVGIDQTTPGTTDAVTVKSGAYQSSLATTRTNDTNAYAAGDVIGTGTGAAGAVLTFAAAGPSGGPILITGADLMIALAAVPTGMTSFRLHLYDATPPSALGDNAAWDLPSGDRANYLGYVDLGTPVDVGSTLWGQNDGVNRQVKLANASTTLYGYLVTNGGFTPAAQTVFTVNLKGLAV